jgi:membrane protein required for beta-lactamase induction
MTILDTATVSVLFVVVGVAVLAGVVAICLGLGNMYAEYAAHRPARSTRRLSASAPHFARAAH